MGDDNKARKNEKIKWHGNKNLENKKKMTTHSLNSRRLGRNTEVQRLQYRGSETCKTTIT